MDFQREASQYTHTRPGRVTEVHVFEADVALNFLGINGFAIFRLCIDFRNRINQLDDIRAGPLCGRDIRDEGEDISGLDGPEGSALEGKLDTESIRY
jgi:hypothetical protein